MQDLCIGNIKNSITELVVKSVYNGLKISVQNLCIEGNKIVEIFVQKGIKISVQDLCIGKHKNFNHRIGRKVCMQGFEDFSAKSVY